MTKTVLVVDDSLMMRAVMSDIIAADETFEVVGEAANGAEAVERARELEPDLILLDIEMPVMDGIDALKRLSLFCRSKVVIVSSTAQVASPQAIETCGNRTGLLSRVTWTKPLPTAVSRRGRAAAVSLRFPASTIAS